MIEDESGMLWFTSDSFLVKFDPDIEKFTNFEFSHKERKANTLCMDTQGNIWLGGTSGIYKFHPESGKFTAYSFGFKIYYLPASTSTT